MECQDMSGPEVNQANQEVIVTTEIHVTDLFEMGATDQQRVMREWFLANFQDPAYSLPYESREGGYIWLDGGPYDPLEALHEKFDGIVPEDVIEALGDELLTASPEWAARFAASGDDRFGFDFVAEPADYFREYQLAMDGLRQLLSIDVPDPVQNTFHGMLFVNLITIMETYLSDTFAGIVPSSERFMRRFVASTPDFRERKLSLAEIYDSLDEVRQTAQKYLSGVVWHRLDVVRSMYHDTLGVSFPENLGAIFRAISVRHALVHRNGKIEEKYVEITREGVQQLAGEIDKFIRSIAEQITQLEDEELQS